MEHFYKNITNWFTFPNLYTEIVKNAEENDKFVEIGVWCGGSLSYFIVESINLNKKIDIYAVDNWPENETFNTFLNNLNDINTYFKILKMNSVDAAKKFKDESLYAVFIDGEHDYDNVKKDIDAWYSKVKPGGYFCGHDYHTEHPGVIKAVDEFITNNNLYEKTKIKFDEKCWIIIKP